MPPKKKVEESPKRVTKRQGQHPSGLVTDKPSAIRKRLRNGGKHVDEDERMLLETRKPLEEWDLEELARGRVRASDGSFRGSVPTWGKPLVVAEVQKRFMAMSRIELQAMIRPAFDMLLSLMGNEETDDNGRPVVPATVKLQAAKYVIDQILGSPTSRVEVQQDNPAARFLASALVLPGGGNPHPAIDGEIVEEGDDDDDD